MNRLGARAHAVAAIVFTAIVLAGGLAPRAAAQTPDKSDVVLVFDFSASILNDKTNRNRFGAALESIASRVDEISSDLVAGDTTVTLIQFAARAVDANRCTDLKLLGSPSTVGLFADCLRAIATAYRKGGTTALTKSIGIDTNYVAAMQQAAKHLPADSERPALILFTDGRHDVAGVPASQVIPTRDQLFGSRSPFALLPVGMGLDPKLRGPLSAGLEALRVVRNMPACASGATFDWPQVVFETAADAGNAVGVALQDATCTFTVAATPTPKPTPTPAGVQGIKLTPGDGRIDLVWSAPSTGAAAITDYQVRCGTGDGTWITSTDVVAASRTASVQGLTNGTPYQCQIAAVAGSTVGNWASAGGTVTPIGRPAAPPAPTVAALDRAITVSVPAASAGVDQFQYECSADNGTTWLPKVDTSATDPVTRIDGLANGTEYRCRAYAQNAIGLSDPSPISDAARPCGSTLECNPLMVPVLSGLGLVLSIGLLLAAVTLLRGRTTGYVIAVADVVHTANIGHGKALGIGFTRDPASKKVTGIVADRSKAADVHIHRLRNGRFQVSDRTGTHEVADGDPVVVADSIGVRHSLVLRAFATNAASRVARRRG